MHCVNEAIRVGVIVACSLLYKEKRNNYIMQLRKVNDDGSLEKIIERMECDVSSKDIYAFYSAADHRRAEIAMGRFFEKVPKYVWYYVR